MYAVQRQQKYRGVVLFYFFFALFAWLQGTVVKAILWLATWLGIKPGGPWIAWAFFTLLFSLLGYIELHRVNHNQKVHDPLRLLQLSCWASKRWGKWGNLGIAILFGTLASAFALKQINHPFPVKLTLAGAVMFSAAWVLVYVGLPTYIFLPK